MASYLSNASLYLLKIHIHELGPIDGDPGHIPPGR